VLSFRKLHVGPEVEIPLIHNILYTDTQYTLHNTLYTIHSTHIHNTLYTHTQYTLHTRKTKQFGKNNNKIVHIRETLYGKQNGITRDIFYRQVLLQC